MIDSLEDLQSILGETSLNDRHGLVLPVLDTEETVFALEIGVDEIEESWKIAYNSLDRTGRYPIVSTCWGGEASFVQRVQNEDFFSRFYFHEMEQETDISPQSLIRASETVQVEAFLELLKTKKIEYDQWEDIIQTELKQTEFKYGSAPTVTEITSATLENKLLSNRLELDRWLWNWEVSHHAPNAPNALEGERFEWFEPNNAVLLFLPTAASWETLAYLHWYGAYEGSKFYIALGKYWEQQFGAVLVAHYGTMLQCFIPHPPQTPEVALKVAIEQDLVAPCTLALPGISLRHYAQGLLHNDRWFLHERP